MTLMYLAILMIAASPLLCLADVSNVGEPLYLTPYIDAGNIAAAVEASRVVDPCDVTDPEQDCGTRIPESYAGFLTVNKTLDNHLFFWYFPSQEQVMAPLLIWLNGGPGMSSMWGLLWENGPLQPRATSFGKNFSDKFEARNGSWSGPFSMLYIDNPVLTGFSHSSTGPRTTQDEYGEDLYEFVLQFYKLFPVLKCADLYIGGQSYAGKYVPVLAHRIHTSRQNNETNIPLRGIYIGGPLFAPVEMFPEYFELIYNFGVISEYQRSTWRAEIQEIADKYVAGEVDSVNATTESIKVLFTKISNISVENYMSTADPVKARITPIMKSDRMRRALHVGNLDYKAMNGTLFGQLYGDIMSNTKDKIGELLDAGDYKVLIYTGDFDILVSNAMVEAGLFATPWSGQDEYRNASRKLWHGPRTSEGKRGPLLGYYSQISRLCRVTIRGAGHQAPHDQPEVSREMMIQFVHAGCVDRRP